MTKLLSKVLKEAEKLSPELQDEIASQLLEDIENEIQWQATLDQPQDKLNALAKKALEQSRAASTKKGGFDEL